MPGPPTPNLYEQVIRETLVREHPSRRPRIRVEPRTIELTGYALEDLRRAEHDLPGDLITRLIDYSRNPIDIASFFFLNPHVHRARSATLELAGEHYSSLPIDRDATIRFAFSPVATLGERSILYAWFDSGPLHQASLVCMASEGAITRIEYLKRS